MRVERFLEAERFSHVTHLVSEVAGELRDGVGAVRPAARVLPGRHGLGRAEGARDADHLRARGLPARPVRGRRRLRASRTATLDTCIAIRTIVLHDGVAHLQAGGGHRRRLRPGARSTRSACDKLAALETAIDARGGRRDDPARRQLRLLHVQPRAPARGARRRGRRAAKRRDRRRRGGAARAVAPRHLPRPRAARGRRARRSTSSAASRRRRRRSASASATRRSSRRSAARSARRSGSCTARRATIHHDGRGHLRRAAAGLRRPGRYHSLAATRVPDELEVSATSDDGEVMARPPPRAAGRRRPVPPRVGAHAPARAATCCGTSSRDAR